jgi:hypothetical protein
MSEGMRSTFRGLSVLLKTKRKRAGLFQTRFTTWRSDIHTVLKVDAGGGFFGVQNIKFFKENEENKLGSAHAFTTYGM